MAESASWGGIQVEAPWPDASCSQSPPDRLGPRRLRKVAGWRHVPCEATATDLEGRIRALRAAPGVVGLEMRRVEREALGRLADFRGLLDRNRDAVRKALDAVLETPLRFTPTADDHYVTEGPVYLGALYPIASDPNGIRKISKQQERPCGFRFSDGERAATRIEDTLHEG